MTHPLVPSDWVVGTRVIGRDGERIGAVERLMLDKTSGQVAYAVVRSTSLLGSVHHYPIPWDALRYDSLYKRYIADATLTELRDGPSELDDEIFDWGDRSRAYPPHPHYWVV